MVNVRAGKDRLHIAHRQSRGQRAAFVFLGIIPLMALWWLLVTPAPLLASQGWPALIGFAILILAGQLCVLLFGLAMVSTISQVTFNGRTRELQLRDRHPLKGPYPEAVSFLDIIEIRVDYVTRLGFRAAPHLIIRFCDRGDYVSGSLESRATARKVLRHLTRMRLPVVGSEATPNARPPRGS